MENKNIDGEIRIQNLINRIPTGSKVSPLYVENRDFNFRSAVRELNLNGDLILNNGNGYFVTFLV